jgi:hypothetical protein
VPGWAHLESADQLNFTRLSGLSNACYKVSAKDPSLKLEPKAVLYRKFECKIIDKQKEAIIFESMSDQGLGPKCLF